MRRRVTATVAGVALVTGLVAASSTVAAQPATFGATLSPPAVDPGSSFTVDGEGCFESLAGAVVLDDGTGIGVGDTLTPEGDGTFSIELTLPGDVVPGTTLTVQVDCGNELETLLSVDLPLEVLGATTTTSVAPAPSSTTPPAASAAQAAPSFTG